MAFVIAFDLDGTLIPNQKGVPVEQFEPPVLRFLLREPLRRGTKTLLMTLLSEGCDIWIYTTSYRGADYIRFMFRMIGIKLAGVVNQNIHLARMEKSFNGRVHPSKSPSTFGIDLLVDDEPDINKEALVYGFDALCVNPMDEAWTEKVLERVRSMRAR